jgi:hypothetical protein
MEMNSEFIYVIGKIVFLNNIYPVALIMDLKGRK